MIRVRYKGPTDTKSSRLLVTDCQYKKTYSFNGLQNEMDDKNLPTGYHDTAQYAAEIFVKEMWNYCRSELTLLPGSFGSDDYFLPAPKGAKR